MFKLRTTTMIAFLVAGTSYAETTYIPRWEIGGGSSRTHVVLTNVCDTNSVQATVKFWNSAGDVLSNTTLSAGETTDVNGDYSVTIAPKASEIIRLTHNYLTRPAIRGFAEITYGISNTSEVESPKCLIGYVSVFDTSSPYQGYKGTYLLKSGDRF
ncbi:MAG: hypothetical protein HWE26_20205 [Alteromonadaceae bacterium]|nr:hypothetical protein [Alteromonadaceae bacterium]